MKRNHKGRFVRATRRRARRNPPKRYRATRRRTTRRRARRNPPAMSQLSPRERRVYKSRPRSAPRSGQKGYVTSAATKAKISAAIRARNAQRRSGGGGSAPARRSSGRRRSSGGRRGGFVNRMTGMLPGRSAFRQLFSMPTFKIAGGAVVSGFVTSLVINKWGAHLPQIDTPVGRVGWRLLIPLGASLAVRRFDRHLADGMLIGAAVSGINEVIRIVSGSPSVVPVIAGRPMATNNGIAGSGGRGKSFSAYAGEGGEDMMLDYGAADDEFEAYEDEYGDADEEFSGMADAWA